MSELVRKIRKLDLTGWVSICILLSWLISVFVFMNARIETNDPLGYYAQTIALYERLSVDLTSEAKLIDQFDWTHNLRKDEQTGQVYSQYPIGVSLMQWPFYSFGQLLHKNAALSPWKGAVVWWVCFGSALYGLVGMILLFYLHGNWFGSRSSVLTSAVIFFGTALYYYMFFQPGTSHSYAFFCSSLFFYFWLRPLADDGRIVWSRALNRSHARSILLGLLLGFCFLVRYLDGLLCLLLVIECFYLIVKNRKRWVSSLKKVFFSYLLSFMGFALLAGIQLWIQQLKHGSWQILAHYDGGFDQSTSYWKWLEVLFSSHHGLFYWHPLLILGLVGLFMALFSKKPGLRVVGGSALALIFTYAIVVAAWGRFAYGANSFGHRFFISLYPVFFSCIAYSFCRVEAVFSSRFQLFFSILILVLMVLNASIMLQFATGVIPPDAPVSWSEMLNNTWSELPQEINRRLKPL